MRIFVSSSFEDLKEHRTAVIRVLRQLGHEVLAMEDMTAASATPLSRVTDMVDRSEAYVGVFAWRYGYVPARSAGSATGQQAAADPPQQQARAANPQLLTVKGAIPSETSITHYEYLRALERNLPVMAFLLDEQYPWPPQLIDGFDITRPDAQVDSTKIRALRYQLQQERVVSWFTTPSDLEARVSAAVTMAGLTRQLDLQTTNAVESGIGVGSSAVASVVSSDAVSSIYDSSEGTGIEGAIVDAARHNQCALKIDLATTWWSTRLYLLAALAERLTQVRRILIVDTTIPERKTPVPAMTIATGYATEFVASPPVYYPVEVTPAPVSPPEVDERFVGQISTAAVLSTIEPKYNALCTFQSSLQRRSTTFEDLESEVEVLLKEWKQAFGDIPNQSSNEEAVKVDLTPELLRRWFRDAMLQQPVHIADLQRASVVDLLRLLDYPSDYVPVLTRHLPEKKGDSASERVDIMDKRALNHRLARSYLVELMDRARIV